MKRIWRKCPYYLGDNKKCRLREMKTRMDITMYTDWGLCNERSCLLIEIFVVLEKVICFKN